MDNWDQCSQAEWLVFSGLPEALNAIRAGAWSVFQTIVQLDCRRNRLPSTLEISLEKLSKRTGLAPDKIEKILEALRKRQYLRLYLPDHPEEDALIEIRTPIQTPVEPAEVAKTVDDPHLRDIYLYRYASALATDDSDPGAVQDVVDLYMDKLSQKVNGYVVEQCEMLARRFSLESIRDMMERGARHNVRALGWVIRELIREERKQKAKGEKKK